jgi:Transposase DDE domain group 1
LLKPLNLGAEGHPVGEESARDVEAGFRRRTDIEDRISEAKLAAGLGHLPSGHPAVNSVWMWASLIAGNLSVLLQTLTGIDQHGRAHVARPRHQLLCVPARLVRHGRTLTLRLPPGDQLLPSVRTRIRELDTAGNFLDRCPPRRRQQRSAWSTRGAVRTNEVDPDEQRRKSVGEEAWKGLIWPLHNHSCW